MSTRALRLGYNARLPLHARPVRYTGNGYRSVSLSETAATMESFLLNSGVEVQFEMARRTADGTTRAILEHLSPRGEAEDARYSGKGADGAQALVSACMEFIERLAAGPRAGDFRLEAAFDAAGAEACDPRRFCLSSDSSYAPDRTIDWVWGFSLTKSSPVLVPANLVYLPYTSDEDAKHIAWTDSNGLASGNVIEEAILHAILEVIERDAVVVSEYNRLPLGDVRTEGLPPDVFAFRAGLEAKGLACSIKSLPTDLPIPALAAFLRDREDPARCSVAFGSHLDPSVAALRALTEAVQLLPPSVNQAEWLQSGSAERYTTPSPRPIAFRDMPNLSSRDIRDNIETCVSVLDDLGSEVIIADLSVPDVPFPVVRALVTGLQPLMHEDDKRFSRRFFELPVRLGCRAEPLAPESVRIWPICGYR